MNCLRYNGSCLCFVVEIVVVVGCRHLKIRCFFSELGLVVKLECRRVRSGMG